MKAHHSARWWLGVAVMAIIALLALFAFPPAHGQGAAPGPEVPPPRRVVPPEPLPPGDKSALPPRDRDSQVAQPPRRATPKVVKGAKRARDAARHGVQPIGD